MCEYACMSDAAAIAAVAAEWLSLIGTIGGIVLFTRAVIRAWERDQER